MTERVDRDELIRLVSQRQIISPEDQGYQRELAFFTGREYRECSLECLFCTFFQRKRKAAQLVHVIAVLACISGVCMFMLWT
jgi:hypothetical protein